MRILLPDFSTKNIIHLGAKQQMFLPLPFKVCVLSHFLNFIPLFSFLTLFLSFPPLSPFTYKNCSIQFNWNRWKYIKFLLKNINKLYTHTRLDCDPERGKNVKI